MMIEKSEYATKYVFREQGVKDRFRFSLLFFFLFSNIFLVIRFCSDIMILFQNFTAS